MKILKEVGDFHLGVERPLIRVRIAEAFSRRDRRERLEGEDGRAAPYALIANAQYSFDEDDVAVLGCLSGGHDGVARTRALVKGKALHALDLEHAGLPPKKWTPTGNRDG